VRAKIRALDPPCAVIFEFVYLCQRTLCLTAVIRRRSRRMTYVIVETCIGVKDRACVDVCPVDCIYEGEDQLYIHPDECIDCGACEPECPVTAIFPEEDVPAQYASYIEKNKEVFNSDTPPGRPKR
jgi:ferredoxin